MTLRLKERRDDPSRASDLHGILRLSSPDIRETMRFPKAQRFVIAQRLQNAVLTVLEGVVSAYSSRKKKRALERASEALEQLRILVRLAQNLGFLTPKKTDLIQQRVDEIGRMLGGWIKEAEQKGQTDKGPRVARRVVEQQSE